MSFMPENGRLDLLGVDGKTYSIRSHRIAGGIPTDTMRPRYWYELAVDGVSDPTEFDGVKMEGDAIAPPLHSRGGPRFLVRPCTGSIVTLCSGDLRREIQVGSAVFIIDPAIESP